MTRRTALLATFAAALGNWTSLKADGPRLTVDLSQWSSVVFKYKDQTVAVPVGEVFRIIAEGKKI